MQMLDLDAFARTPLQHEPCDFLVVPNFVRAEAMVAINQDYPLIDTAGNFAPEDLTYGPAFSALLEELHSPELRRAYAKKFGFDVSDFPLQVTVRKYSEASDGNVHNDSKMKMITTLIYFNKDWQAAGGRLRLMRSPKDINEYAVEVPPEAGTLLTFRRSETSFHGFLPYEGERRSLQMYWVKPKRDHRGEKTLTLKKRIKRFLKERAR